MSVGIRPRVQKAAFIRDKWKYKIYPFHLLEKLLHFYKLTAGWKVDSLLFFALLSEQSQPTHIRSNTAAAQLLISQFPLSTNYSKHGSGMSCNRQMHSGLSILL